MFQGKQLETVGETACPHCNVTFSQLVTFRQHVYQHVYPYVCQQCEERLRTDPVKVLHTCSETIFRCEMCTKQFSSLLSLSQHQVIHGVPQFHCYECGRSFHHCVSEFSCSVSLYTENFVAKIGRSNVNIYMYKDMAVCCLVDHY